MEFTTGCDTTGTSLRGYISAAYVDLVAVFGEPRETPGDAETQVCWSIVFTDGTVATVYDWKQTYRPVQDINEWNIGGYNVGAVAYVTTVLRDAAANGARR